MLVDEIPQTLSCGLALAQKDSDKEMDLADSFISTVIHLTGSAYKTKDYKIEIKNGNATFTRFP